VDDVANLLYAIAFVVMAVSVLVAIFKADRHDLPAIFRAVMRSGSRDDGDENPPSLPEP
jgi:hypothetical protein